MPETANGDTSVVAERNRVDAEAAAVPHPTRPLATSSPSLSVIFRSSVPIACSMKAGGILLKTQTVRS